MLKLIGAIVLAELIDHCVEAAFGRVRRKVKTKFGGTEYELPNLEH